MCPGPGCAPVSIFRIAPIAHPNWIIVRKIPPMRAARVPRLPDTKYEEARMGIEVLYRLHGRHGRALRLRIGG